MKNVFSEISLYLIGVVWFMVAGLFALFAIVNPESLKSALNENGTYQKVVPAVLDEAQKQNSEDKSNQLPINEPEIQAATNKAFPPKDLQIKSETVINSVFAWLEGKTESPQFRLDFTNNKQVLATEIGKYTQKRAATLPPCDLKDIDAALSGDPFTIKCLPPGITPTQLGHEASRKISANENFLKDPVVSSDTFKPKDTQVGDQRFNFEALRNFYQKKSLLSWLLPSLMVILAIGGIMMASDRFRAVKKLRHIFFVSAVSLGLIAAILKFASHRVGSSPAPDKITGDIALPIVSDLLSRLGTVYIWFTIISLVFGFGLLFVSKHLQPATAAR
jgi:hypothetical protein